MSHFSGLVVLTPKYLESHSLEESLEKYDEQNDVPEYSEGEVSDYEKVRFIEYYAFTQKGNTLDSLRKKLYSELLKEKKVKRWSSRGSRTKEDYIKYIEHTNKERYAELFKEEYKKYFDAFVSMYGEFGKNWNSNAWRINPESGKWERYSTYNPDSKFDWYNENGRWSCGIKTKSDKYVNKALLGEIDWTDFKPEDYEEEEKTNILGKKYKPLKENVRWHFTESKTPYCLVIDGDWYGKGSMGWFGISSDEMTEEDWGKKFFELLKDLPKDSKVYNIDFHI